MIPVAAGVSTPPARTRLEFAYDYKNRRIAKRVYAEESGTGFRSGKRPFAHRIAVEKVKQALPNYIKQGERVGG